jgi:hypothetical protein
MVSHCKMRYHWCFHSLVSNIRLVVHCSCIQRGPCLPYIHSLVTFLTQDCIYNIVYVLCHTGTILGILMYCNSPCTGVCFLFFFPENAEAEAWYCRCRHSGEVPEYDWKLANCCISGLDNVDLSTTWNSREFPTTTLLTWKASCTLSDWWKRKF